MDVTVHIPDDLASRMTAIFRDACQRPRWRMNTDTVISISPTHGDW
jgi:hypothetical protein